MSIAAIARVIEAPDPPDSGTTLRIEHEAAPRFPIPPLSAFDALLWQTNRVPVRGTNAEDVRVVGIEPDVGGDVVTLIRAEDEELRVPVYAGMNLSLLRVESEIDLGDERKVRGPTDLDSDGGTLTIQSPQGVLTDFSGDDLAHDEDGWYYPFVASEPGHYASAWEQPDQWYVNYGATL